MPSIQVTKKIYLPVKMSDASESSQDQDIVIHKSKRIGCMFHIIVGQVNLN